MDTFEYFKEHFDQLQLKDNSSSLSDVRQNAFNRYNKIGIPTIKNEEWKYTRISGVFNTKYQFPTDVDTVT